MPAESGKAWYHVDCFTVPRGLDCIENITGYEDLEEDDVNTLEEMIGTDQNIPHSFKPTIQYREGRRRAQKGRKIKIERKIENKRRQSARCGEETC